ncbi:type I restriction endonuclease [Sphingomonas sp.]|uniref:type I restriction endonuclease n=1 Tax=Sphingomonas sp. TaxID=28214 RepID=UPI0035A984B0
MPFLQALGYDVFNPSEVVPEFTADVGTKKGEKVDYAICLGGKVAMLVECKPANVELDINHGNQLYRYFSVTEGRIAVLTNGVAYKFYSDIDQPNKMDDRPFFTFSLDEMRRSDPVTLERFTKAAFDVDRIVEEAEKLKTQSLLREELRKEFAAPSEDFVRLMAAKVHQGKLTAAVKDRFQAHLVIAIADLVRDMVTERLTSALNVSSPPLAQVVSPAQSGNDDHEQIITTDDEIAGYRIVQAICSRIVAPKRIVMRDQRSYCAVLLDDNNRKTVARLYFNSPTTRHVATFVGKEERRVTITDLTDIYALEAKILERITELEGV